MNPAPWFLAALGAAGLVACAGGRSPSRAVARDIPACVEAERWCEEARAGGSAGMREMCLRKSRECREARAARPGTQAGEKAAGDAAP